MQRIGHGDTGPAVADVQRRLHALGLLDDADRDGTFGDATAQAVRVFQRGRRLMAHGDVDDDTWAALVDAGHELGDRLLYLTRPMLRGDDVRELQLALSRLGFDIGATDGIHGPDTDEGLRDFQHNAGLTVDGIAGDQTVRLLGSLRRHHQHATTFEVLDQVDDGDGGSLAGRRIAVDPAAVPAGAPTAEGAVAGRVVIDDVARRLVGQLTARGAHATLTTAGGGGVDPTATERAALVNRLEVDALVSIGCTTVPTAAARGVTGHHFGDGVVTSRRGRALAVACVDELEAQTGAVNCDVHPSTAALLRESRAPAVTIEIGFLSNPTEAAQLADPAHRHRIATALATAVQDWAEQPVTAALT